MSYSMKLPEIDLKELEKEKQRILKEREDMTKRYAEAAEKAKGKTEEEYMRIVREVLGKK